MESPQSETATQFGGELSVGSRETVLPEGVLGSPSSIDRSPEACFAGLIRPRDFSGIPLMREIYASSVGMAALLEAFDPFYNVPGLCGKNSAVAEVERTQN